MFKKVILMSLIGTLAISTLQPKKAEAGAILLAAGLTTAVVGYYAMDNNRVMGPVGFSVALVGLVSVAVGATDVDSAISFLPYSAAIGLIVLDAEGNQKKDALTDYFAKRYTFVDNLESLGDLSQKIISKATTQTPDANGHILVRLTKNEVQTALQSADVTPAQVDLIASELQ